MKNTKEFLSNEDGQSMVEYGLIIGLIAIVVIAGLVVLGPKIKDMFTGISDNLDTTSVVTS